MVRWWYIIFHKKAPPWSAVLSPYAWWVLSNRLHIIFNCTITSVKIQVRVLFGEELHKEKLVKIILQIKQKCLEILDKLNYNIHIANINEEEL